MQIPKLNILNIRLTNSSFVHQNPISFKSEQKDTFVPTIEASAKREIKYLEEAVCYLKKQNEISKKKLEEIKHDIETLKTLASGYYFEEEINDIIIFSNSTKKEKLKNLLTKIIKSKFGEEALSSLSLNELSTYIRKTFYRMPVLQRKGKQINDLITEAIHKTLNDLHDKCDRINSGIELNESLIENHLKEIEDLKFNPALCILKPYTFDFVNQIEQVEKAKTHGAFVDLNNKEYGNISSRAQELIKHHLDTRTYFSKTYLVKNSSNQTFLNKLIDFDVISSEELNYVLSKQRTLSLFEYKSLNFPNQAYNRNGLILLPKNSPIKKILEDIENGNSCAICDLHNLGINPNSLPFTFKKYMDCDKPQEINYTYVDLKNEDNNKILNSPTKYRYYLSQLPFLWVQVGYDKKIIDMDNEENKKLLEKTQQLYPQKSKYYFESLGSPKSIQFNVPVEYLESIGFSKANILIELIHNGKLDGIQDENGQYHITIDTKNRLGKNKNLDVLYLLRKQDPRIKTFKEVAHALEIKQQRLEYAIFTGEVELIKEYINPADRELRFINITTPKNQEFIRKVKFEQELEKQLKESRREAQRQAKIENKDLTSRIQGVRMALVWEFMPNTKAIGSMLAKKDGYVSMLLAKESNPEETLTNLEEAKINSYRKEMWMLAGTDELKEAYKKAAIIMKTFKEDGLSGISEEYLPIFERYGFTI